MPAAMLAPDVRDPDHARRRFFTVDEVNAALPRVREAVHRVRRGLVRAREIQELTRDMEEYYGDAVDTDANLERARYGALREERTGEERAVAESLREIAAVGGEVKDAERGLVDFYHLRDREVVYLCWENSEDRVAFWHPLETGYTGRRPL